MTEKYDPYENAIAKRINDILKQEFAIDKYDTSIDMKSQLIKNAIKINNQIRPHLSNSMLTPNQMHQQNKLKRKSYKKHKVAI
jgi:transposase InsO family protein